LSRTVIEGLT